MKKRKTEDYAFSTFSPYDIPFHCLYGSYGATLHNHSDFYEFCLVMGGEYASEYETEKLHIRAGELLFISCGETHSFKDTSPLSYHYSFLVKKEYFEHFCKKNSGIFPSSLKPYIHVKLSGAQFTYLSYLLSPLPQISTTELIPQAELLLYNLLFACTHQIVTGYINIVDTCAIDLKKKYDNYHSLTDGIMSLCKNYPISLSTLQRSFKKLTGCTILEYRTQKRMEYAAQLLTTGNYQVAMVSNSLNISDPSHFAQQFKKYYGMTPSEYQKKSKRKMDSEITGRSK